MGERVVVVGNHSSLGSWNVAKAQRLKWSSGHKWFGTLTLSQEEAPSSLEYKAVLVNEDGGVCWEQGDNTKVVISGAQSTEAISVFQRCMGASGRQGFVP